MNLFDTRRWARCGVLLLAALLLSLLAQAQRLPTTAPPEGIRLKPMGLYALVGATVVTAPGQKLDKATIIVRSGVIEAVGTNLPIPTGAEVRDLKGRWVYPGLVDAYSDYGQPKPAGGPGDANPFAAFGARGPDNASAKKGAYYWNEAVKPERRIADELVTDPTRAAQLRGIGFATVHSAPADGIVRGTGAVVLLGDDPVQNQVVRADISAGLSFAKGTSKNRYPTALNGSMALIRQAFADAQWYRAAHEAYRRNAASAPPERNLSLEALNAQLDARLPFYAPVVGNNDYGRMAKLSRELGFGLVLRGTGYDYERAEELAAIGAPMILPLAYPELYDVEDPAEALNVPLLNLKRWEQAPANAYWLTQRGLSISLTASGLTALDQFWPSVQKAVAHGLTEDQALAALTTTPAKLLGVDAQVGTVAVGKLANLVVASGKLFDGGTSIYETWVGGMPYRVKGYPEAEVRGTWRLSVDGKTLQAEVSGDAPRITVKVTVPGDSARKPVNGTATEVGGQWLMSFPADTGKKAGELRLKGFVRGDAYSGAGTGPSGAVTFTGARTAPMKPTPAKPAEKVDVAKLAPVTFPNGSFGLMASERPKAETVLFKGATVWTNGAQGTAVLDVLVEGGKLKAVGANLSAPAGARTIDATGKHLSSGIIDEHSHIVGERGINEFGQAISAEVRMLDVLNPEDVNMYRQLAGGVTAIQLLHGSANAIGGQSALIKLRWGATADELPIAGAPGFIKFALGENPRQANNNQPSGRYPQTRMGVEQLIRDAFQAAQEYQRQWDAWRADKAAADKAKRPAPAPPRRDLELETVAEILAGQRHITCHSYVQSEITMLMRLAEQYGIKVNTFTHILEGYKVADKMAAHGAAASSFSDWWAYKFEVYEAIPHNAALLHRRGIPVAINSDDAEMARRLNQEAAKTVKYGGLSEADAWKTVTLNPAKMLRLDRQLGSIEVGKDADLVLWNAHPLSIYAKPEQTWVDGRLMFSLERDAELRRRVADERRRLIDKMIAAKKGGQKASKFRPTFSFFSGEVLMGCESEGDFAQDQLDAVIVNHGDH